MRRNVAMESAFCGACIRGGFLLSHCLSTAAALVLFVALLPTSSANGQSAPFVYVPNFFSNNVSVIDTSTNVVVGGAIPVGIRPVTAGIQGDQSLVYVTNFSGNNVSVINTASNAVIALIPVGNSPWGLNVTPDGKNVYVANSNDNTVTPINVATNTAGAPIAVGTRPKGVTVTPDGKTVYVANANSNNVTPINVATNTAGAPIAVGFSPFAVTVTPDGKTAYVSNFGSNTVTPINVATNTAGTSIPVGSGPIGIAVTPDGKTVYVANFNDNTVTPINVTTNTAGAPIPVGTTPLVGVAVSPDGKTVYVASQNGNTVTPITVATNTPGAPIPVGSSPQFPGICSNGNALLAGGLTFKANTSGALACTLASGPTGSPGPVFTGGTLQFAAAGISSSLPISLHAAGGTFDTSGNNATLSGAISGPGGLTKIGLGTLILSGAGSYAGATSINAGTLQAAAIGAFSPNSAYTVASGAFLDLNGFSQTIGSLAGAGNVMLGTATLTTGSDNTSTTFSGGIGGAGGLTKIGTGMFMLSGANSYSGGTTIQAGTLALSGLGTLGAASGAVTVAGGALDLGGTTQTQNGGVTLASGKIQNGTLSSTGSFGLQAGTISAALVGAGSLTKTTPGTVILTGTNTYTGTTTINAGTLEVDGAITNSSVVTVNAGGTLTGAGLVDPPNVVTIASGATFAPGNGTPGSSMTIAGNLAFQSGAVYLVQVNPATASFANVTGAASLAGAVQAVFASGSYATRQYDILHSAGLTGSFGSVATTNLPGFQASLSYTATDVLLTITAALVGTGGFATNQQNVATSLNNFFNNGGTLPPNFVSIFGLTGSNLANALTQLSGEVAASAEVGAFKLTNQFLGLMLDPFVDGRSGTGWPGGGGSSAMGFAPEREATSPPDIALAYAKVVKALPRAVVFDRRWSAWGSGFGGSNFTRGDLVVGSHDVTASDFGFAGGLDYHVSPDAVAGFALAGGGTNWGLAQGLGAGRSDAFQAGVYGSTRLGPAYIAAALAFADHWMSTDRFAPFGDHLTANFQGQSYAGRLEGGYRFAVLPTIGITPYAALQAQSFHTPRYSESDVTVGSFGLAFASRNATDTRSELGARFDDVTVINGMPLWLRGKLAWAHDWVSNPSLAAVFQALPGAAFVVSGATPAKDSALASAGAELHVTPNWSLAAKFDGEFAARSQTYAGTGTVRYTW
jgi:autotransporter-associated beta strand protein/YVTN family beta-propeller protein